MGFVVRQQLDHEGIVRDLRRWGCDPVKRRPLESEARSAGLPVEAMRMKRGLNMRGALRISRYATTARADLIHTHGYKADILI